MEELTFNEFLMKQTKNNTPFSLSDLKRRYPKHKDRISEYLFLGLIAPVDIEFKDSVRAHIHR